MRGYSSFLTLYDQSCSKGHKILILTKIADMMRLNIFPIQLTLGSYDFFFKLYFN